MIFVCICGFSSSNKASTKNFAAQFGKQKGAYHPYIGKAPGIPPFTPAFDEFRI